MTISYKWLSEYLPVIVEPERLSRILTSIGLEVESLDKYEEVKGGLKGLVIGEVLECEKHPDHAAHRGRNPALRRQRAGPADGKSRAAPSRRRA